MLSLGGVSAAACGTDATLVNAPVESSYQWPFEPRDRMHPVSNSSREFQDYWDPPVYYHGGIDIPAKPADPAYTVLSVSKGEARYIDSSDLKYRGVEVTNADGIFLYLHLTEIPDGLRDGTTVDVDEGDPLGKVVMWTNFCAARPYHHMHFEVDVCDDTGDCRTQDPLAELSPSDTDRFSPRIEGIDLVENEAVSTFDGTPPIVSGAVDIVVKAYDKICSSDSNECDEVYRVGLYDAGFVIERLRGTSRETVLERKSVFSPGATVPDKESAARVFKTQAPFESSTDYCGPNRDRYYYVVTNSVADDVDGYWDTTTVENGEYVITVYAKDQKGNTSQATLEVIVDNHP